MFSVTSIPDRAPVPIAEVRPPLRRSLGTAARSPKSVSRRAIPVTADSAERERSFGQQPQVTGLARADAKFAREWWHWFFFGQLAKPRRRVINADPDAWSPVDALVQPRRHGRGQSRRPRGGTADVLGVAEATETRALHVRTP
ncbi:hypothetical protein B0293_37025 [Amycolatopsis azurea DSM 43854]|uniref:Uncharacterized protein n=1 Tax=Amycolatopsis azurea DSM 43854 TaxID=1238180 RepID=A0ABX3J3Z1_9PSEU|nr:hypothetical protein B0293_37025 [Amycolatopsis azurea DSM 43854]